MNRHFPDRSFRDRSQAADMLAHTLRTYRDQNPLILAIPRGALPMGEIMARELRGDLDVVLVHKIGAPENLEYAIGAVSEFGDIFLSDSAQSYAAGSDLQEAAAREIEHMRERRRKYSPIRPAIPIEGRIVIIIDDGLATGSTMLAAVRAVRVQKPARIIVAVPVASRSSLQLLRSECDELVALSQPEAFYSISQFYQSFEQVTDEQVERILAAGAKQSQSRTPVRAAETQESVLIVDPLGEMPDIQLAGELTIPSDALGLVLFAHGSGSSRLSPRNQFVAKTLNDAGIATLLFDLLTEEESLDRARVFNIPLLAERLVMATQWAADQMTPNFPSLLAYFGASTGGAAAIWAAADLIHSDIEIAAVVSRGGRPDLALEHPSLAEFTTPTLLIVGGDDEPVLSLNREAQAKLKNAKLLVVPGATHLFEEPGTLQVVAKEAANWFRLHFEKERRSRIIAA